MSRFRGCKQSAAQLRVKPLLLARSFRATNQGLSYVFKWFQSLTWITMILNPISGSSHRPKTHHQHYSTITSLVLVGVWRPMDSQILAKKTMYLNLNLTRHSVENPEILNFRVTDLNGRYKVAFSEPHLIHKKKSSMNTTSGLIQYIQWGWRWKFIPWTFTNKKRVPKDFRSQCQDTRQVSLLRAVVARGAANHREGLAHGEGGRLSIFSPDALVCWRSRYKVGHLPVTNGPITSINGLNLWQMYR